MRNIKNIFWIEFYRNVKSTFDCEKYFDSYTQSSALVLTILMFKITILFRKKRTVKCKPMNEPGKWVKWYQYL